jgi:hypothetical protein
VLEALFRVLPAPLVAATRVGMAPGKFGAWVAAAGARPGEPVIVPEGALRPFLAGRPVSALPVDEAMLERLDRLGVRTLGELARFPAPALVAQFGEEGARARAWSTGERIDPVRPWHRPRPLRVTLEFPVPVGQVETLHGALDSTGCSSARSPSRSGAGAAWPRPGWWDGSKEAAPGRPGPCCASPARAARRSPSCCARAWGSSRPRARWRR